MVVGADVEGVECGIPATATQLMLTAKFWVMPDEPLEGHTISIQLTSPDGERADLCRDKPLKPVRNVRDQSRPSGAQVAINLMPGLASPGEYMFHVIADGQEVKTIPLDVVESKPGDRCGDDEAEWSELEARALPGERLDAIAEYLRSTGQASA